MINPADINLSSLPWLPLASRSAFPRQPCIYFAIDATGLVQYIGRSIDLRQRWLNHHRHDELVAIGQIRIAYLSVDVDLLPEVEAALIGYFQPRLNGAVCFREKTTSATIQWRLRSVMIARKVRAVDLAKAIGVNRVTVETWKSLEVIPPFKNPSPMLEALCRYLECSVFDLIVRDR